MQVRRPRRKLICALTVAALFLGIAQAADASGFGRHRIIEIVWKYVCLPSVNHYGQLSRYHCKQTKCKIIVNHKRHTCIAICRGKVRNKSHRNQCYYNIGLIPPYLCECCDWYKDIYKVSRQGRCFGLAWGKHYYDCDDD